MRQRLQEQVEWPTIESPKPSLVDCQLMNTKNELQQASLNACCSSVKTLAPHLFRQVMTFHSATSIAVYVLSTAHSPQTTLTTLQVAAVFCWEVLVLPPPQIKWSDLLHADKLDELVCHAELSWSAFSPCFIRKLIKRPILPAHCQQYCVPCRLQANSCGRMLAPTAQVHFLHPTRFSTS